jgi:hypothetical protein
MQFVVHVWLCHSQVTSDTSHSVITTEPETSHSVITTELHHHPEPAFDVGWLLSRRSLRNH